MFLSFLQDALQRQRAPPPTKEGNTGERIDTNTFVSKGSGRQYHSNGSLNNGNATFGGRGSTPARGAAGPGFHSNPGTLRNGNTHTSPYSNGHAASTPHVNTSANNASFNVSAISDGDLSLTHSPAPEPQVRNAQLQPRTLVERARMNVGWLDSSLSIMEQGTFCTFEGHSTVNKHYCLYLLQVCANLTPSVSALSTTRSTT